MRKLLSTLSLAGLVMGLSSEAAAFVIKDDGEGHPVHWPEGKVGFAIDVNGARELTFGAAVRAVEASFAAWQIQGANLTVTSAGAVAGEAFGYDKDNPEANHNLVTWSRDTWTFSPESLAVTVTVFKRGTGELVDADIIINEVHYSWGGATPENDLQNVVTHEVGHLLGLGHSDVAEATMFATSPPGETEKRTLESDDRQAVFTLYPGEGGEIPEDEVAEPTQPGAAYRNDAVPQDPAEEEETYTTPETPKVGCSVSLVSKSGGAGWLALVGAALLVALRRKGGRA